MRSGLLVGLALVAACSSSGQLVDPPVPVIGPSQDESPAVLVTSVEVAGTQLVAHQSDGSTLTAPADGAQAPQVLPSHDGVLAQVGLGASTTVYGLWARTSKGLVRVVAPAGEPGAGQPWQIAVGAGVVTAEGFICTGYYSGTDPGAASDDLVVITRDGDTVTQRSYVLVDGVAQPDQNRQPAPPADQVGTLDC